MTNDDGVRAPGILALAQALAAADGYVAVVPLTASEYDAAGADKLKPIIK